MARYLPCGTAVTVTGKSGSLMRLPATLLQCRCADPSVVVRASVEQGGEKVVYEGTGFELPQHPLKGQRPQVAEQFPFGVQENFN